MGSLDLLKIITFAFRNSAGGNSVLVAIGKRKWNLFWSNFILSRLLHLCTQCCIPLRWLAWLVPSLNLWSIEFATDLTSRVAWSKQAGVIIKWGGDWDGKKGVRKHGRWDQGRRQYCPRFNTTPSRLNRGVYSELNADAMETQEEVKAKHQTSQLFVQFDLRWCLYVVYSSSCDSDGDCCEDEPWCLQWLDVGAHRARRCVHSNTVHWT